MKIILVVILVGLVSSCLTFQNKIKKHRAIRSSIIHHHINEAKKTAKRKSDKD